MATRSEPHDLRYELKLACPEAAYPDLRMALRLDRAGVRALFPERLVQSLYLDTPDQRALQENLAGLSTREKLRVRWYGPAARGVRATLERKCREDSLGWKELLPLEDALDVAGEERRRVMEALRRHADPLWRARLAPLEPVQWVRYRREYLTSADRRVRITLDRELRFSDQRRLARLSDVERTPSPRILVVELKCAAADESAARDLVGRLPIPLGRCSKFVLASEPSSGPLVSELQF